MGNLAHLCSMSTVAILPFQQDGREEWIDFAMSASEQELSDHFTMISILAKAFLGLLALHPELKPRFPVQATSVSAE